MKKDAVSPDVYTQDSIHPSTSSPAMKLLHDIYYATSKSLYYDKTTAISIAPRYLL